MINRLGQFGDACNAIPESMKDIKTVFIIKYKFVFHYFCLTKRLGHPENEAYMKSFRFSIDAN